MISLCIILIWILLFLIFIYKNINRRISSYKKIKIINKHTQNILPMSGSEPDFDYNSWNDDKIISTHNCYAYLLDDLMPGINRFPQPGMYAAEKNRLPHDEKGFKNNDTCDSFFNKLQKDIPELYFSLDNEKCNVGFYKGFFALDPTEDYHFYRQDSNGLFSHKPGDSIINRVDSDGNIIYKPDLAKKDYGFGTNYTINCNYFCVPVETDIKYNVLYN